MAQFVIDIGAFPNDGTGDPLRTAFEYVNLNFDQIFNAGPVLSNIEIRNNTIYSTNTNGNIVLNPNGIGNVIANAHVIPDQTRIRNLGAPELKWDTVYAQYLVGDGNGISNVTAANISNGTARVDAYFNGNVAVSANGVANVAVFTATGLLVPNTILAGTVSGNINTTNISGNSVTISATGSNQGISLAPNGTGNVSVNFRHIVNLAEPVNPQDAATKYYVDTVAEGLDVKASCLLATYAALPAYTYNNGASGVGATITGNAVGTLSIDSTAVTANARVLIKNESGANEPYNGIYVVARTGNASVSFQLIRSTDFDNGAPSGEIPGAFTFIETGTVNADTGWVCTTNNPVTMGVTPIIWSQFSGAGAYTAGLGLDLVGGVFNVLVDDDTTEINLNNQVAVKPGANLVTPNIGSATGTSLSLTGAITANTVNTSGDISTTANITGGNLNSTGAISAAANITGGNIATAGFITASGQITSSANIIGGNIRTAGQITATGNVTGANLVATANVVGNNVFAANLISAGGNVEANNISVANSLSATTATVTGNITSGNILNNGLITSTGNIVGGNIRTAGQITATGNLTVGNVRTAGLVSAGGEIIATGNISGADITATGIVTATGNIISNQYFIGNGAFLTGIDATSIQNGNSNVRVLANGNVTVGIAGTSNLAVFANTGVYVAGLVSASGNAISANIETGNIQATGNVSAGNVVSNTLIGTEVSVVSTGNLVLSATGNINVGNTYITNLANPVNLQDAATKYYVDTVATGLDPKESVVYATASALPGYTYNNGVSGVGATLTSNIPGALTIDGNSVQTGQRVLVKNETGAFVSNTVPSAAFNGIYDVTVAGDVGNAWVLTRSADFDLATEMASSFTFVEAGSTNADTGWVCTTNNPITVGFTQIIFTQFSGAGTYTAGNGLSLNGTVFNVNTDGNIAINGNNQVSIAANAVLNSPNITNATATSLSASGNITGGNILFGDGIVSGTGNIYANKIFANIQGNIDAAGNLYEVQFNTTGDQLGANANFTYDFANNVLTVANGNIDTGNVSAVGNIVGSWFIGNVDATTISATGNVTGGNLLTSGTVSVAGNITGGNIDTTGLVLAGNVSTTGNVDAGNVLFGSGIVSGTGNIYANKIFANIVGNIDAAGNLYEIQFNTTGDQLGANANFTYDFANNVFTVNNGNITAGNLVIDTAISAGGNITGGNINTAGLITATGNVIGGNVVTAGLIDGGALNIAGNAVIDGDLAVNGNVTYINVTEFNVEDPIIGLGRGANNTPLTVNDGKDRGEQLWYFDDTGNVEKSAFTGYDNSAGKIIAATDVTITNEIVTVNNYGGFVAGNIEAASLSATSSVTAGNILTGGIVSATGNITGGNIDTQGNISSAGNITSNSTITGGNIVTSGTITATGTATLGNVITSGLVSAAGNITGGNIDTVGQVSAQTITASGNITGGNILFGNGVVSGTGNIYANTIFANISGNIDAAGSNTEVQFNSNDLLSASANFTFDSATNTLTVSNGNVVGGNLITGGQISAFGNITTGNVFTAGNVSATGNITGGNVNTSRIWSNTDLILDPTGNIVLDAGKYINNVNNPVQAQDAATKQYVDDAVSAGIHIHQPVYLEANSSVNGTYAQGGTTATVTDTVSGNTVVFSTAVNPQVNDELWFSNSFNGVLANTAYFVVSAPNTSAAVLSTSYNGAPVTNISNGSGLTQSVRINSGVGATLTNAGANATLVIDGVTVSNGDRILIYSQGNAVHNGVYDVTEAGNATTAWQLTRSNDADRYVPDNSTGIDEGSYFYVLAGNSGAGESYVMTAPQGPFIIGYDSLTFTQFSASQVYTANTAAGLSLTGTVFSAKVDNNTTAFDGGGNIIVKASANLVTPNIGDAVGNTLSLTGNITGGNIFTGGIVSSASNIIGANISTSGTITATGNVYGSWFIGNVDATTITASGTVTGGNLATGGTISASGSLTAANITGDNFFTAGVVSATGNITGGNLLTAGTISTVGNIFGGNITATEGFFGNIDLTGDITVNSLTANTFVSATGNVTAGNLITAGLANIGNLEVTGTANITSTVTAGNLSTAGIVTATGNITGGNIITSGSVTATGNVYANTFVGNLEAATASVTGNIDGGNLLISGIVSSAGNITAPYFIGNISGNIDAGGANTQIQFNDDDILAGSPGFTFDKTSNLVTVTGNVDAGNIVSQGVVTANAGVYGDIYTTSIDSADSSAIIVTPDVIMLSGLNVNQDITVGNIVIPSYGDITVGNVRIANLANPVFDQDAVTKRYVDSAIGNVLPIITNQTISPDGSSLTYALNQSTTAVGVLVTINGISQTPNDSYTVSGNAITFAETLLTSDIVQVRFLSGTSTGGGSDYGNSNVVSLLSSFGSNNIVTTGNITGNTAGYAIGYKDVPQISFGANATAALVDAGKHYYSTTAGNLSLTLPDNNSVAFPTGATLTIVINAAGNVLVNQGTGVSLYQAGSSTTGNRVVGAYGLATVMKVAANTWVISGTGVY